MSKILHIAPHYGGGVGTVLKYLPGDKVCLNPDPRNKEPLFQVKMIPGYDIILVHVWNHPSLFDFLINAELPHCRLIGWSHMSGLHAPYILFKKLINYFDEFYYTSPISNETGIQRDTIWSSGDITDFTKLKRKSKSVTAGYAGTVDFSKMHPDFTNIIENFGTRFLIVGDGCDLEKLKSQADNRYTFTGIVPDVKPYLEQMDLFIYPLNPTHFGTCEQTIGEALASGLPCFVLDNPCEQYIMNRCAEKRGEFWHPIREKVLELYSVNTMIQKWTEIFERKGRKTLKTWMGNNVFLESIGNYARVFKDYIKAEEEVRKLLGSSRQWSSKSKGSIYQYLDYFQDDHYLKLWSKLL